MGYNITLFTYTAICSKGMLRVHIICMRILPYFVLRILYYLYIICTYVYYLNSLVLVSPLLCVSSCRLLLLCPTVILPEFSLGILTNLVRRRTIIVGCTSSTRATGLLCTSCQFPAHIVFLQALLLRYYCLLHDTTQLTTSVITHAY